MTYFWLALTGLKGRLTKPLTQCLFSISLSAFCTSFDFKRVMQKVMSQVQIVWFYLILYFYNLKYVFIFS